VINYICDCNKDALFFFSHGDLLSSSILTLEEAILRFGREKRNGRRVVFTNGCFELLHPGHIRLLQQARALGDVLIVALNSDASVRQLKGAGRPVIPERERAEILAALECVDAVVIFDAPTPRKIIAGLLPDVLVKGDDWPLDKIVGRGEVEAAGGKVERVRVLPGYSTTAILQKIRAGFTEKPQPKSSGEKPQTKGSGKEPQTKDARVSRLES